MTTAALLSLLLLAAPAQAPAAPEVRTFTVRYGARIGPVPEGTKGPLDVFLPLPANDDTQRVVALEVEGAVQGSEGREATYGNRFWHARIEAPAPGQVVEVGWVATVERRAIKGPLGQPGPRTYSAQEKRELAPFLRADKRVPLSGGPLEAVDRDLRARLGERLRDPEATARGIYDLVIDTMEYKKVGTGWGNGDTFWACSAKYGNCTDFHSVFISLARRHGIPTRFEMGFPVPADRDSGEVKGYHCWVNFYLPRRGWVPADASEADKHPEQRELLFGGQPPDRLKLSEGRDLRLGPAHQGAPLNYFVYPYAELDGAKLDAVTWRFDYANGTQAPRAPAAP